MCGIVGGYGTRVREGIKALAHRGPDAEGFVQVGSIQLGHTRLAILDLDERSNQPFVYRGLSLTFNGEIWNYVQLRGELIKAGYTFKTTGDTEVLAAALHCWGEDALIKVDGMFAIGWTTDGDTLHLARDRFGEIPLHVAKQKPFYFASELKALQAIGVNPLSFDSIKPGHYATVSPKGMVQTSYYLPGINPIKIDRGAAASKLYDLIKEGTVNRTISDVPVCTLLSGGIDSSVTALFLAQQIPGLVAYTAVYNPKSNDLKNARLVARHLGIELREVLIPNPSPDDLASVIHCIEMDYKAQIEIGWACIVLARQMREDGFKVTFSGEGSDELWASYGFAYHALKTQDWHSYRRDLFLSQSRKNFVRCNKIFMAHSIECRLPFLHYPLVEFALSLPQSAIQDGKGKPKAIIQDAFRGRLPPSVIDRPKVAFQDGLGLKKAIETTMKSPERFYHAEYRNQYG